MIELSPLLLPVCATVVGRMPAGGVPHSLTQAICSNRHLAGVRAAAGCGAAQHCRVPGHATAAGAGQLAAGRVSSWGAAAARRQLT